MMTGTKSKKALRLSRQLLRTLSADDLRNAAAATGGHDVGGGQTQLV